LVMLDTPFAMAIPMATFSNVFPRLITHLTCWSSSRSLPCCCAPVNAKEARKEGE